MKNELGALKSIRSDILTGYGYSQMLSHSEVTEEELAHLCKTYPDFGNEIAKRYGKTFTREEVKETTNDKPVETKVERSSKRESKGVSQNRR